MTEQRKYWIDTLEKIALPVLGALAEGRLHRDMPVENGGDLDRADCTHLEALGRLVTGIAPWLGSEGGDEWEVSEREELASLCRAAIANAVDPESPDRCNFETGGQRLVDAAFLAHGILRAKGELYDKLPDAAKANLVAAMKRCREVAPCHNNWLLFSAMVETLLFAIEGECDMMRVDYATMKHDEWYKGDGTYGDGEELHWDYYNSYVIQPMLVDVMLTLGQKLPIYGSAAFIERVLERAVRYAELQEQLIAPDGSYPAIGRSITYRMGAFQTLSQVALMKKLPDSLSPASVRCALTAVISRSMEAQGTFDGDGWLRIGVCGHQPELAQDYISTGSLYLCSAVFLALGLPESDPFWSDPDEPWSWKRIWGEV